MPFFSRNFRPYIRTVRNSSDMEFSLKSIAQLEPILAFLYEEWWSVEMKGLERLPAQGPALLIGNGGGVIPWSGLMLLYALMKHKKKPRKLSILADLDWVTDERLYSYLREIGFVPCTADNAKRLFEDGETVAVFPEGVAGAVKSFGERYRLRPFDWTKIMPAVEMHVPLVPFAAIGPEESFPIGTNLEKVARLLSLPAFPVTPAFPWLPFPLSLYSLPIKWKMAVMKPLDYRVAKSREELEETSKQMALFTEGEVQAEVNRLLRTRVKALF